MYIKNEIVSGDFIEIEKFQIYRKNFNKNRQIRIPRDKTKKSREEQIKLNNANASKKLRRLLHANFKDNEDMFITCTFIEKIEETLAINIFKNFLRRLKKHREKNNMSKLKYIYCIGNSKKDGIHFHAVINKFSFDYLREEWFKHELAGRFHISTLNYDKKTGLKGLADYFIKNSLERIKKMNKDSDDDIDNIKKWVSSKSLTKPTIKQKLIIGKFQDNPKAYKDYKIVDKNNWKNRYGKFQYIEMVKIQKRRI